MAKRSLLALGLAAIAVAGAVYFDLASGADELIALLRGESVVAPGFIGVTEFGRWRLICAPSPDTVRNVAAAADQTRSEDSRRGNSCRINQEVPAEAASSSDSPAIVIAANFSLVGPHRSPALMLRLPPTARPGDAIALKLDNSAVPTLVRDCTEKECIAAGALSDAQWMNLAQAKALQVTFPAGGRQGVILDLPVDGLTAAMAALARAQTALP